MHDAYNILFFKLRSNVKFSVPIEVHRGRSSEREAGELISPGGSEPPPPLLPHRLRI
jgi:hypothetical protein